MAPWEAAGLYIMVKASFSLRTLGYKGLDRATVLPLPQAALHIRAMGMSGPAQARQNGPQAVYVVLRNN